MTYILNSILFKRLSLKLKLSEPIESKIYQLIKVTLKALTMHHSWLVLFQEALSSLTCRKLKNSQLERAFNHMLSLRKDAKVSMHTPIQIKRLTILISNLSLRPRNLKRKGSIKAQPELQQQSCSDNKMKSLGLITQFLQGRLSF